MAILRRAIELALPACCAACKAWGRAPLCTTCADSARWIREPLCRRCGNPMRRRVDRCRDCEGRTPAYDRARSAAVYEGPIREALKAFKLLGERRHGRAFAPVMAAIARELPADVVTWVPSTRRARNARGFVPPEELARPLARELGLPARELLRKVRETKDQAGLSRDERRFNQRDAFAPRGRAPRAVLLIDDIYTTGATVEACAVALKQGGCAFVSVLTFARSL